MVTGGTPARKRAVMTFSIGGAVVASFALGMCCQPLPPVAPQQPDPPVVVVDAAEPEAAPEAGTDAGPDAALPPCEFVSPRSRGRRPDTRIVGGKPADLGEYPYAVSVSDGDWHYCGATVINENTLLSAAHCQIRAGDVARVGASNRLQARQIRIVESRIHPRFDANTLKWDVAVAKLESPAGVPPAQLAVDVAADSAIAIGWGRLSEGGPVTNQLQEVTVPIVSRAVCNQAYGDIDETQVCADAAGKGSCQGDSGGALLQLAPEGIVQLGIVSFGVGCARPPPYTGVYTNVSHPAVRDWIAACSR